MAGIYPFERESHTVDEAWLRRLPGPTRGILRQP